MKTKTLITGLTIYLINSLVAYSQNVGSEQPINDTASKPQPVNTLQRPNPQNKDSDYLYFGDSTRRKKQDTRFGAQQDTTRQKQSSSSLINTTIDYSAADSTIYSIDGKKVYLFGDAEIKYEDITLKADYIEADLSQNIIYAEGVPDSVGNIVGQPIFVQGSEEIKSKNITYNLKTEKGYIKGLYTEQEEGYLHSEKTKKTHDHVNLYRGKYTTCELEDPHFYIWLSKGKVIPDKAIVSSFAFLVIEDVPLYPLMIPFGFFPNTKEKASGFLIPTFGEENARGFYLRNGGYYFNLSEYADLALRGDIYSKGSWQIGAQSKYKLRYKFNGNVDLGYSNIISSEKGLENYVETKEYRIRWTHSQDPKARPNSNFSANVNISSMGNNKYNSRTSDEYLTNTTQSSISYRKTFANTPFSMSMNLRHSQNTRDSIVNLTVPQMTVNMSRIFPFQRRNKVGKSRWYENIGITYTGNFENRVSAHDTVVFTPAAIDKFKNGVKHQIPLSTSLKVLKHFNLSPSVNYTERWYFKEVDKRLVNTGPESDSIVYDTTSGFNRVYDYSYGIGFGTTLYGMYQYKSSWLKAIRHVARPSVSMSYRPDFSDPRFGYFKEDPKDSSRYWSYYDNAIYGVPGTGKSGMVSFSLNNNVEMKVANKKDTAEVDKKIKLLESLNFSTSYNMIADSLNWSPVNISARTTLFKALSINMSARGDFYALDTSGTRRINQFNQTVNGKPLRITSARVSTGFTLNSKNIFGSEDSDEEDHVGSLDDYYSGYDYFEIPWNLRLDYSLNYNKTSREPNLTQTLSFSGDFSLTKNWKISFRSGWDFKAKDFTYTSFNLTRDLHCWVATVSLIPFGQRKSYNFTIGVKSSVLQDLKYNKNKSWMDNMVY